MNIWQHLLNDATEWDNRERKSLLEIITKLLVPTWGVMVWFNDIALESSIKQALTVPLGLLVCPAPQAGLPLILDPQEAAGEVLCQQQCWMQALLRGGDLACPRLSEPLLASMLTPSSTIWLVHVYQRALLASMLTPSSTQTCGSHLLPLAASFLHFLPDLSLEFWAVGVFLGWALIKTQLWRPWVSPGHRDGMRPSIPSSNTPKRLNNGRLFLWGILAPRAIKSGVDQQLLGASSSEWGDQLSSETSKWYMVGAKLQIEGYWYFFLGCVLNCFSYVQFLVTLWTVAHEAPLSMGFSRKEYWSGFPFPPPGSSQPRDWTLISYISCIGRRVLYH